MTLLHQAAQKAVEALTRIDVATVGAQATRSRDVSDWADDVAGIQDLARRALQDLRSALQQQPEPVAWYWEHVMQSSHGIIEAGFSGTPVEVTDDAMWNGKVATIVTELHVGRRLLPPKIAADMGLPTELPALQQQEVPREPPESELVCYEAYAALGMFLMELAEGEHPQAEKLLDNLSQARLAHKDVLPFSPSTTQQQEAGSPQWPNDPEGLSAIDRVAFSTAIRALLATAHDLSRNQGLRESCAKLADHLRRMTATASPTPESAEKDDAGGGKEQ